MRGIEPQDEVIAEVDADNTVTGEAAKGDFYRSGRIHRASHVLIFNTQGEMLIQKRASGVLLYPGLFDFSCSGSVRRGESYREAMERELREELGIRAALTELFDFEFDDRIDHAFHRVYATLHDGPFSLDNDEVSAVHWVDLDTLQEDLHDHTARFAPQLKNALRIYFRDFEKRYRFGKPFLPELVTFKRGRKNLHGELFTQESERAVILLHGFMSTRHSSGRYDRLAVELHAQGIDVLRFDFSGCGESDKDEMTIANEVEDLGAAITFMKERGYRRLGLVGHSLGGLVALHARDPIVKALVLLAPVTAPKQHYLAKFDAATQQHLLKQGKTVINYQGRKHTVTMTFVQEREAVDQHAVCSGVRVPVLLIHGEKDTTLPLDDSRSASELFPTVRFIPMPDAGHDLFAHFDDTAELTAVWFDEHL